MHFSVSRLNPDASSETYRSFEALDYKRTKELPGSKSEAETNWPNACLTNRQERDGTHMIIGAAIAGLLIISLFLEMIGSSPKPSEERQTDAQPINNA
jgi:hypothetical protein